MGRISDWLDNLLMGGDEGKIVDVSLIEEDKPTDEKLEEGKKRQEEARKENEKEAKAEDDLKHVIDQAKLECKMCVTPMGDLKVNYDTPSIQDKKIATVKEKDMTSIMFKGNCTKSPNSASPCAGVMQLGEWKDTGTSLIQDQPPLLLKSTIKCNFGGSDIKITDCGQKAEPENIDVVGAPVVAETNYNNTGDQIILFFRSEKQAIGFPKLGAKKMLINNIEQNEPLEDEQYTQSFGFDYYRPDLYGKNTKIYEKEVDTGQTLENSFEIDNQLSLEIKNKRGRSRFIDKEFKLVDTNSANIEKYFIPNLCILQGKTITFYAKYYSPDNTPVEATIILSDPSGIETFTQNLIFNKSEELKPITITTSSTVAITTKKTLSITITKDGSTKIIGKCNILPNKLYEPNFVFIDVYYNSTNTTKGNYTNLVSNLNSKAFNQAGINIKKSSNQYILDLNPDDCLRIDRGESLVNEEFLSLYINAQKQITNFDKVLEITSYKFYEILAVDLFNQIETELKKIKLKDKTRREHPLLLINQKLEDIIKGDDLNQIEYNKVINNIINFIKESKINFLIALMCNNLESASSTTAMGYLNSRGLIISKVAITDSLTCAHEIGHNLNLGHTFVKTGEGADLHNPMTNTLENIMDYLPGNPPPRKSFVTFQWLKMQLSLERYNISPPIDVKTTDIFNSTNCIKDNNLNYLKYSNPYLKLFSYTIIRAVFNNIQYGSRNVILLDDQKDEKDVLKIISEIINNVIIKLQS